VSGGGGKTVNALLGKSRKGRKGVLGGRGFRTGDPSKKAKGGGFLSGLERGGNSAESEERQGANLEGSENHSPLQKRGIEFLSKSSPS